MQFIHSNKQYIERTMYPINPYVHSNSVETPAILNDGNTVGWWDATLQSSITKDGANLVSNWADISGNGHDLSQSTNELKPISSENGIEFVQTRILKTSYFDLPQPIMIYIVADFTNPGSSNYAFDGYNVDSVIFYNYMQEMYAGNVVAKLSNIEGLRIRRLIYNGASSKGIVDDGIGESKLLTGNTGNNAMNGLTLGGRATNNYGSNMYVKEFILRKIADTDTNSDIIYGYLKKKYNL